MRQSSLEAGHVNLNENIGQYGGVVSGVSGPPTDVEDGGTIESRSADMATTASADLAMHATS